MNIPMSTDPTPQLSDIRREFTRIDAATVKATAGFASSILADVAGRRGAMDGRIQALNPAGAALLHHPLL